MHLKFYIISYHVLSISQPGPTKEIRIVSFFITVQAPYITMKNKTSNNFNKV